MIAQNCLNHLPTYVIHAATACAAGILKTITSRSYRLSSEINVLLHWDRVDDCRGDSIRERRHEPQAAASAADATRNFDLVDASWRYDWDGVLDKARSAPPARNTVYSTIVGGSEHACWQPRAPSSPRAPCSIKLPLPYCAMGGRVVTRHRPRAGHNSRPHSMAVEHLPSLACRAQLVVGDEHLPTSPLASSAPPRRCKPAMPPNGAADLTWRCLPRESSPLTSGMAFPSTMRGAVDGETLSWVYISSYLL